MSARGRFAVMAIAMGLGIGVRSQTATACSCALLSFDEEFESSDVIFVGRATEVRLPPMPWSAEGAISSADPVVVTFAVSQAWKGVNEPALSLWTRRDDASCGFPFEQGQEYLVFANTFPAYGGDQPVNERLPLVSAGLCSRTSLISEAGENLALLRARSTAASR